MLGAAWLNFGSLILGLIAWALPVVNLMRQKTARHGNRAVFPVLSVGACAVSLCMQIFYTNHLVRIEDWSALLDTSRASALAAAALLLVTIILNAVAMAAHKGKEQQN